MSKILVVDDEQNIRFVFKEVLTEEGYDVFEAQSAEDTFDILNRELIDLVLLDIKLRSESGLDVLERITREFPDTPVLLCSAYVSFQNDNASWLADGYLVKSSVPEELLEEVDKVLKMRGKV
jgi:DNA-binding response OmpR family regulator